MNVVFLTLLVRKTLLEQDLFYRLLNCVLKFLSLLKRCNAFTMSLLSYLLVMYSVPLFYRCYVGMFEVLLLNATFA